MLATEVMRLLAEQPHTVRELCEATGRDRKTVHRTLDRLHRDRLVTNEPAPTRHTPPRPHRLLWKLLT